MPSVAALAGVRCPVLQSSANRAGEADPRALSEVPTLLRAAVDLVVDGGELPGTPSTVVDLRRYEVDGEWRWCGAGAVGERELTEALHWQYHFDAGTYAEEIRADLPAYDALQEELAGASGAGRARGSSSSGPGPGRRPAGCWRATRTRSLVGIDENEQMLAVASGVLPDGRVSLLAGRIEDRAPGGPVRPGRERAVRAPPGRRRQGRAVRAGARRARARWAVRAGRRRGAGRPGCGDDAADARVRPSEPAGRPGAVAGGGRIRARASCGSTAIWRSSRRGEV